MKLKNLFVYFCTLLLPIIIFGQTPNPQSYSDVPKSLLLDPPIFPLTQLKKGMKGFGLTVFEGSVPEVFSVEIIGILKNDGPRTSLILARFSGGPLERTGVIAGMSGSPVYIDNKLVGAVSHAFPWSKEPIGAIRPIEEMLTTLEKRKYQPTDNPVHFVPFETSLREEIEQKYPDYFKHQAPEKLVYADSEQKKQTLYPIKTPILFSGIDDSILDLLRGEMESYGFIPINNGRGGKVDNPDSVSKELLPGDAVGISLIRGDMSSSPVGTVTYRKGNDVLIFGHPSFFRGSVDMPMTKEFIHTVLPNLQVSFKMSGTLFEVGRIFDDRYSAVAGEIGTFSKMIPLEVNIKNEGQKDQFHFEVVKDGLFFPNFMVACVMQSVLNAQSKSADTGIKFKFKITVKNISDNRIDTIETFDYLTGDETTKIMFQALFKLTIPIQTLLYNPYAEIEILDVQADVEVDTRWNVVSIVDILPLKSQVQPGDELPVLIKLREYKGKEFYKKLSLKVPANVSSDKMVLGVGSAKNLLAVDKAVSIGRYIPKNYDHLLKLINRDDSFNELVVWLEFPGKGLILEGEEHPNLPSSLLSMMKGGNLLQKYDISDRIEKHFKTNYLVNGMGAITLPIIQKATDDGEGDYEFK